MTIEVVHGEFEYRMQGGEIHRRPAERDGLGPWDAAWLVVDKKHAVPPTVVKNLQSARQSMRFD